MLNIPCIQVQIHTCIYRDTLPSHSIYKNPLYYAHRGGMVNKIQVQYEALIKKIADITTVSTCNYKDYNYNQYRGWQIIHNTFLPVGVGTNK